MRPSRNWVLDEAGADLETSHYLGLHLLGFAGNAESPQRCGRSGRSGGHGHHQCRSATDQPDFHTTDGAKQIKEMYQDGPDGIL